jgi:tetratricopeptide (TPR) repeat protein
MTYLPRIALLLVAANLSAQEIAEQPPALAPPPDEQTVPVAADPLLADEQTPEQVESTEVPGLQPPVDASDEDQLIFQYNRYLQLMQNRVYDEADSVAKRVVELSLRVWGPQSTEFSKALINLAIVQHYTEQFDAAQQNFLSAIEIIENNEDRLNEQLLNPLKGLGASQLEGGRPDLAGETFRRAVHVSHVNEGPHNLQQVDILESLAETNLRLGLVEDARQIQDMIYTLNARAYSPESIDFVPSLLRRADWQHRAGLINDERATLRRAIRIIEEQVGEDDLQLVDPLLRLGKTYFYIDTTVVQTGMPNSLTSGEIFFKRAMRIAAENPATEWQIIARASLALGDYYMFDGNSQRARTVYKEAWNFLSDGAEQLEYRRQNLEVAVLLRERPLPQFVTPPENVSPAGQKPQLLNGSITLVFAISTEGRAANLKIIEMQPAEFSAMQRTVQREMRNRLYRPRFVDAEPVATEDQMLVHQFFYTQADLDEVQSTTEAEQESDQT